MAKVSGLPTTVSVGGMDISNDVLSMTLATPYGVQDVSGLDKSAMERLLLRADAELSLVCAFNVASNRSHLALKTPGSKAISIVLANSSTTITFTAVQTDYQLNLGTDGSLQITAPFSLSSGTPVSFSV